MLIRYIWNRAILFLKTYDTKFDEIIVTYTDENG